MKKGEICQTMRDKKGREKGPKRVRFDHCTVVSRDNGGASEEFSERDNVYFELDAAKNRILHICFS